MGSSGDGYSDDDPTSDAWDLLDTLPEPGQNELLDSLCDRKHIGIGDLARLGARLGNQGQALCYRYGATVRYRDLITGRIWMNPAGVPLEELKIVRHGPEPTSRVIVVEGETDAARLSGHYPCDVAVMPAGAQTVKQRYLEQLETYDDILVGLDHDANGSGDEGARKITTKLPQARRWSPAPDNDWCEKDTLPPLPPGVQPVPMLVWGEELFDLELPEVPSLLEGGALPIGGMMLLHGWKSSFKSWLVFDLACALAEGGDAEWACLKTTVDRGLKVGIVQYEIRPSGYTERMKLLRSSMEQPQRFQNIAHYSPGRNPDFVVGNQKHEDKVFETLAAAELDVVIADPIRQMIGARSMNDEEPQQQLNQFFRRFNNAGMTVIMTTHDNKSSGRTGGGTNLDTSAGAVLVGSVDSVVSVQRPKDTELDDPKRNLRFTVRDGAPITPRRFTLTEDVRLEYGVGSWETEGEEGDPNV